MGFFCGRFAFGRGLGGLQKKLKKTCIFKKKGGRMLGVLVFFYKVCQVLCQNVPKCSEIVLFCNALSEWLVIAWVCLGKLFGECAFD